MGPPIKDEVLTDTITAKQVLWMFGYVNYRSELRPTEQLVTRFCHKIARGMMVPIPEFPSSFPLITFGCNDPTWTCIDSACPRL